MWLFGFFINIVSMNAEILFIILTTEKYHMYLVIILRINLILLIFLFLIEGHKL